MSEPLIELVENIADELLHNVFQRHHADDLLRLIANDARCAYARESSISCGESVSSESARSYRTTPRSEGKSGLSRNSETMSLKFT